MAAVQRRKVDGQKLASQVGRTLQRLKAHKYFTYQIDAQGGASLAGDFIWSLTCTDLASQWTEGRTVWNKGAAGVLAATRAVEAELPFALLGFD